MYQVRPKKDDVLTGDLLVETEGDRAAGRAEQGDDAAGAGDVGHAHEEPLAEIRRFVTLVVETVDRDQQGKDRGGDRGVGHDKGQGGGHDEAAEVDAARLLADQDQHFVGQTLGQSGFGEDHADDDRSEDEPDRGVHELLEGELGAADRRITTDHHDVRADQEERLDDRDGDAGDTDWHHLEDPPHGGKQKQTEGRLALRAELECLSHRVDGVGPWR